MPKASKIDRLNVRPLRTPRPSSDQPVIRVLTGYFPQPGERGYGASSSQYHFRERLVSAEEVNQETQGGIRDDSRPSSRHRAGLGIEDIRQAYQQMEAPYSPSLLGNEVNAPTYESLLISSQQLPLAQPAQESRFSAFVPHSESLEEPPSPYAAYSVPQQQSNIYVNSTTRQTTHPQSRSVHARAPSIAPGTRSQVILQLQHEQAMRDRRAESASRLSRLHVPPPYGYQHYMPPYRDQTQRSAGGQPANQTSQLAPTSELVYRPDSRHILHSAPPFFQPVISPSQYSNFISPYITSTRHSAPGRSVNQRSQLPPISGQPRLNRTQPSYPTPTLGFYSSSQGPSPRVGTNRVSQRSQLPPISGQPRLNRTQPSYPTPTLGFYSSSQGPSPQAGTSRVSRGSETPLSHINSHAHRAPLIQQDQQRGMPHHREQRSFPPNGNNEPLLDSETFGIPDSRSSRRLEEQDRDGDENFGRDGAV